MLTDTGDTVFDPFAGSCVTGEVCESLRRNWICCEIEPEYIEGAKGRFIAPPAESSGNEPNHYKIYSPCLCQWTVLGTEAEDDLPEDGGQNRPSAGDKNGVTPTRRSTNGRVQPIALEQPRLID